ncbi:iron chelate uptake ABC transporter family permease subunit [Muriicola jejuensis]|uniref:Iron chelate uptake ABC transporter family permease subunit n=1 Tax=Muriicola jejuensis TaxID=504488 RepID=A0A6P0UGH3_9FLAO|nr:iron chelate uptake ABC transporter family permease subunit [Muriicola jejuensis]
MILVLILCFCINISLGSVEIPFSATLGELLGYRATEDSWSYIIWEYRLPKAFTAILVGGGLSLSGLLMQTLFRNPLAGPFVLGISSGASLGAALLILGGGIFSFGYVLISDLALTLASSLGSILVLLTVVAVARRVKDTMALLIIGLMFASITAAVVTILSYFAKAEELQQYIFWTFGTVGNLSSSQVIILGVICFLGLLLSISTIKSLNALLLGESYARSLGVRIGRSRNLIIIATGLLAGSVTAFAGPIAFIGLAVPHLTRQLFNTTDHRILVPGVVLYGAILLLLCDTIAQLPSSSYILPINAITSIVGAPVVIWLLLRRRNMIF